MDFEPTQQNLRDIHEQAVIIEDMFKKHADKIRDEFGVKVALNVFFECGRFHYCSGTGVYQRR